MVLLMCIINQGGNTLKSLNFQHIILLISVLTLIATIIVLKIVCFFGRAYYTAEVFSESNKPLQNPYCGFYHIIGYTLSDSYDKYANYTDQINKYTDQLVLLEINLKNYHTTDISEKGLEQLNDILAKWAQSPNGTKLILRFLYDWDGIALATEPDSLNLVLKHIEQIAPTINRHRDCIYIMQGVFIGNWGEMHHSKFCDVNSLKQLINKLNDVIDPSIYLSLRTPAQWRSVTEIYNPPEKISAFSTKKPLFSRLGLFNDGILGSESDLGTYAEGERKKELIFQNKLCRYVPNGGEVVYNSNLSYLETAVSALKTMHISYLNEDYDSRVIEKWKSSVWTGEGAFNGCDGYSYIKAHLGYRYFIDSVGLKKSGFLRSEYTLEITVKNSGFSNTLKPFESSVTLINKETEDCVRIPIDADFECIGSKSKKTFTATLPVKELKQGEYLIYFSVKSETGGQTVFMANESDITKYGYLLGRLKK